MLEVQGQDQEAEMTDEGILTFKENEIGTRTGTERGMRGGEVDLRHRMVVLEQLDLLHQV